MEGGLLDERVGQGVKDTPSRGVSAILPAREGEGWVKEGVYVSAIDRRIDFSGSRRIMDSETMHADPQRY